ncbi:MAG: hypothetical protein J6P10_03005 [Aeriscardovia sp.]|nr:hypothetical protein [Aeriscardovia sp.]
MASVRDSSRSSAPVASSPRTKAHEAAAWKAQAKAKEAEQKLPRPALLASSTSDSSSPFEAYAIPANLYSAT